MRERFLRGVDSAVKGVVGFLGLLVVVLLGVGVFDLFVQVGSAAFSGALATPMEVVSYIDSVILLLILVEIVRDIRAYIEDEPVLPIILEIGVIAVVRKIITIGSDAGLELTAGFSLLLLSLGAAWYLMVTSADLSGPLG